MAVKLIADELIVLAAYPANDGWPVGADGMPRVPPYLVPAVAVALLAELALMGAITVERDRVLATGHEVRGEPELAETAAMITARPDPRSAAWWATRVAATAPERRRLVVLRREDVLLEYQRRKRGRLGSSPETWWFVREDDPAALRVLDRLKHALGTGQAGERIVVLLAVMHACGLHRAYFHDRDPREREQRIRGLVEGHWAWRAARSTAAAGGG